tara:strand:+ start:207 stop:1160 length:954 start_codon:yes stop_codon:yes gene_type:complete
MIPFITFQIIRGGLLLGFLVGIITCLNSISGKENVLIGYLLDIQKGELDVLTNVSILMLLLILCISRFLFNLFSIFSYKCRDHLANDFEAVFSHVFITLILLLLNEKATLGYFILSIFINLSAFELLSYYHSKEETDNILIIVAYVLLILPMQIMQILGSVQSNWIIISSVITWSFVTLLYCLHFLTIKQNSLYKKYTTCRSKEKYSLYISKQFISTYIITVHIFSSDIVLLGQTMNRYGFSGWMGYSIFSLVISWLLIIFLIKIILNIINVEDELKREMDSIRQVDKHIESVGLMTTNKNHLDLTSDEESIIDDNI